MESNKTTLMTPPAEPKVVIDCPVVLPTSDKTEITSGKTNRAVRSEETSEPINSTAAHPCNSSGKVYKGKWLSVVSNPNLDGTSHYVLWGQLPVFEGIAPANLSNILVNRAQPDIWGLHYGTEQEARTMLLSLENSYKTVDVKASQTVRSNVLSEDELRACEHLVMKLRPLMANHPDFIREAEELFYKTHGNEIVAIGCQEFLDIMIRDLGPEKSKKRPQRWRWAMNVVCNAYGIPTGNYDTLGQPIKNMPLAAVTRPRLLALKKRLPRSMARQVFGILPRVMDHAVQEGYLRENPACGISVPILRSEVEAKANEEIAVDSPAQIQIALDIGATYRNGYFLPHLVFIYYAHIRPEGELPKLIPSQVKLDEKLIRLFSIKVQDRRVIHLSENAVAMLRKYWDGRRLKFDGWEKFQAIMRAAQGYDVGGVPKWFARQLPPVYQFTLASINNLTAFSSKLSASTDPVYQYLHGKLGEETKASLEQFCATKEHAFELQSLLVGDLNKLITGPFLADDTTFPNDIELSPDTETLKTSMPTGTEMHRLNRMLLSDACHELAKIPRFVQDLPRHTGRSVCAWIPDWAQDTFLSKDKFRVFKSSYDGLISKTEAAVDLSLLPSTMEVSDDLHANILSELVQHKLIENGKYPEKPIMPHYVTEIPRKKFWLPPVSDEELVRTMFEIGTTATSKKYRVQHRWLLAVCAAKRLRTPPTGRYLSAKPEDVPVPPPLVTMSRAELESVIAKHHGISSAAEYLGIDPTNLTAYCYINGIATPSRLDLGHWFGHRPRVKASPKQIKAMLSRGETLENIAQQAGAGISVDHLKRYCQKHGINISVDQPIKPPATDLETIKKHVAQQLAGHNISDLETIDALDLALRQAPNGLTDEEIIDVLQSNGLLLTLKNIHHAINYDEKGSFVRYGGRVHLLRVDTDVDLDQLHSLLMPELQSKPVAGQLEAIRRVLTATGRGISVEQLSTALSWFNFHVTPGQLLKEMRRYVCQARLQVYRGTVTLPDTPPSFTMRVAEKEPTPNLAEIRSMVQAKYSDLVDKELTNVELMEFVLSQAPQGLWTDEFLDIAKSLGIMFREWSIQSVTTKEAKGCFQRHNGRLSLIKSIAPRITKKDVREKLAVRRSNSALAPVDLMLEVLQCFPGGLTLREWLAAARFAGHVEEYKQFRARAYYLAEKGRCVIIKRRAITSSVASAASPMPRAA